MDIIFRLRFLFWVLVLALWGAMVHGFYFDPSLDIPQIRPVHNPYRSIRAEGPAGGTKAPTSLPEDRREPAIDQAAETQDNLPAPPEPSTLPRPGAATDTTALASAPRGLMPPVEELRKAAPSVPPPSAPLPRTPPGSAAQPPGSAPQGPQVPRVPRAAETPVAPSPPGGRVKVPPGFKSKDSRHFTVVSQSEAGEEFLSNLETLYGNLMVDLSAFSPWARDSKVAVYLFDDQESYRKFTGRPPWSGGASSLSRRALYAYKSDDLMGILAHELTHLYFDSFFGESRQSPLWLSEGLATLVQTERGFSPPDWLAPNMESLASGAGFPIDRLVVVTTTAGADDGSVRLWYTQSYSLVRFLLRMQRGPSFLHLCRRIREGEPLNRALLEAYGMPYNRLRALEHAWRYDLTTHRLTTRAPGGPLR